MPRYEIVEENVEKVWEFQGEKIWRPIYRCKYCSKPIPEEYAGNPGTCYDWHQDKLPVGENIAKIHSMTFYITDDIEKTEFMNGIYNLKDKMENTEEFAKFLSQAFEDYPLGDREMLVVPPSGTADSGEENHMVPVAENLSERVGITFNDITFKKEDYPSQKGLSLEERIENVMGKIGCSEDSIDADKALVVDDIATSCATMSATAEALLESGVRQVEGLAIARGADLTGLKHTNILREIEE